MLFLRAPYGEEKLFGLVRPAGGSWGLKISESTGGNFGLHAAAGAHHPPRKAQATSDESRKSNDNVVCPPEPGKLDYHTQPGAQNRQEDSTKRHTSNASI